MPVLQRRVYQGGCHCGAHRVSFETAIAPDELDVRACQCSFCRKHGNNTASDPDGDVLIRAKGFALQRYTFGLRSADFLVCRECGVFVAALMQDPSGTRATLNLNVLNDRNVFTRAPRPMDFDAETLEARHARRRNNWTPARLVID